MPNVNRPAPKAPVRCGVPLWGLYDEPFSSMNLDESRGVGLYGSLPRLVKRFRLKEWQHIAAVHPDIHMSFAVVDAKIAGKGFASVFHRGSCQTTDYDRLIPGKSARLPDLLWDGHARFEHRDLRIEIHNKLAEGRHEIAVEARAEKGKPALSAQLVLHEEMRDFRPLVAVLPLPGWMPVYTHKIPCPVEGTLRFGDTTYVYERDRDIALLDVHKGFYPVHTFWKWATFAGKDRKGRFVGANLTHNVVELDEEYNENALWFSGRLEGLSAVRYDIPSDSMKPWHLRTTDGRVELTFVPQGMRQSDTRMGPVRSWYKQPFGLFSGTLRDSSGEIHEVKDVFGVSEQHEVWW